MINFFRALCVILFFAGLTACGGGGGGGNTVATSPMTMTMTPGEPTEPTPTEPEPLAFDAPELGGLRYNFEVPVPIIGASIFPSWLIILSLTAQTQNTVIWGNDITLSRQVLTPFDGGTHTAAPQFDRASLQANGIIVTNTSGMTFQGLMIGFQTRASITTLVQLCPISWMREFIGNVIICPSMSPGSFTPNMREVVYAAMADGFSGGIGIGESPFAFSGRYDGDNRAAGFSYDFGKFALRTDYSRLPSKQNGEVYLDTFRFGALRRINDEVQLYGGMDNYDNAIFAVDVQGENLHRLGFAIGDDGKEYAVKYELRVGL